MTTAHARDHTPCLVAVGGWTASGKSSVATRLSALLGASLLSGDALRGELFAAGTDAAYAPGFSPRLYRALLEQAGARLAAGDSVVVDAAFPRRALRAQARALARSHGVPFRFVECRAPERVCRARLRERERRSPGWQSLFEALLARWEDVDELPADEHRVLDTSGSVEALDLEPVEMLLGLPR